MILWVRWLTKGSSSASILSCFHELSASAGWRAVFSCFFMLFCALFFASVLLPPPASSSRGMSACGQAFVDHFV